MKKTIVLAFLLTITGMLFSQNISIKGTFSNCSNDSLFVESFTGTDFSSKNFVITKSQFDFKITIVSAGYFKLGVESNNYLILILHPGDNLEITADASNLFGTSQVKGSPSTTTFYEANMKFASFQAKKDSLKREQERQMQMIDLEEENYAINFIKQNPTSLTSLMMAERATKEQHREVLNFLDSNLFLRYPANKMVQDFHAEVQRRKFLNIGTTVPEIVLPDKNGKEKVLSSLKGKVVLIDFWATWCGPCKAEIPNLKKIYNAFHDKGFEIYSVSIDRSRDQWLAGSSDMPWISVFDEGGKVASEFNVQSIPFMVLVGKDGKLIAKNLRGNQLYMAVADLFQ